MLRRFAKAAIRKGDVPYYSRIPMMAVIVHA